MSTVEGGALVSYEGQRSPTFEGLDERGRSVYRMSQSTIKQTQICPERGRRTLLRLDPDGATDSTAKGRAVHTAIELSVSDMIDGRGPWDLDDMIELACQEFDEEMELPNSRWVKVAKQTTIYAHITNMLTTWYNEVMPNLDPMAVEVNFGPVVFAEDDDVVVKVTGQVDYIDRGGFLGDWKTAGRKWEAWEHQRWDVQPTMYLWALQEQFDDHTWKWVVLVENGELQVIDTERGYTDFLWLKEQALAIAHNLEANYEGPWLKNDTHALCSEKWCNAYAVCKGATKGVYSPS